MSDFQKGVIKFGYSVKQLYTLPSIYKDSNRAICGYRSFPSFDQLVQGILQVSKKMYESRRPLLIFFETDEELMEFLRHRDKFPCGFNKISENMEAGMRDPQIDDAGRPLRQTVITAAFSRGTDFKVHDSEINQKGGMHIIQVYISSGES